WVQGSDKKVYQAANLKKGSTTGLEQISNTIGAVNIYPNPAKDIVNISFDMLNKDNVTASMYSITGQLVKSQEVKLNKGQNHFNFNTSDLASGFYNVIIFDSKNNSFAQRVSIAK